MHYLSRYSMQQIEIASLQGKTIKDICGLEKGSEEVRITTDCGSVYLFCHLQNCCENVNLCDFDGDAGVLKGALILSAEEVQGGEDEKPDEFSESWTWTFYKIETSKGGIWMRWLGESNGYYSESVDILLEKQPCATTSQTAAQNAGN